MKINTRTVMDWDGNILEQDWEEYSGPAAHCGGGGGKDSTPAPPPAPAKPATGRETTAATTQAVDDQQNKVKQSMGQQGTILTSPLGAQPVQQQGKSLLGR